MCVRVLRACGCYVRLCAQYVICLSGSFLWLETASRRSTASTVRSLRSAKIFLSFQIDGNIDRWIIANNLIWIFFLCMSPFSTRRVCSRGGRRDRKYDKPFRLFQDAADSTCSCNDNPSTELFVVLSISVFECVCVYIYINVSSYVHVTIYMHTQGHVYLLITVNCYVCRIPGISFTPLSPLRYISVVSY